MQINFLPAPPKKDTSWRKSWRGNVAFGCSRGHFYSIGGQWPHTAILKGATTKHADVSYQLWFFLPQDSCLELYRLGRYIRNRSPFFLALTPTIGILPSPKVLVYVMSNPHPRNLTRNPEGQIRMNRSSSSKIQMPDEHSPHWLCNKETCSPPPKKKSPGSPLKVFENGE